MASSLCDRLLEVRARIDQAAKRAGRDPADVCLVAVSKKVTAETMVAAYHLSQVDFGENRVQEFREKRPVLDAAGIHARYHMLGHLQTNKAQAAVGLFDIIQSVDSLKLARVVASAAAESGRRLQVLLEVDFSGDPVRSGFQPQDVETAAEELVKLESIDIQGLMTVAPLGLVGPDLRMVFHSMRVLRDGLVSRYPWAGLRHLSMGMSGDFEMAIEEGATIVRVGRAIFGDRP